MFPGDPGRGDELTWTPMAKSDGSASLPPSVHRRLQKRKVPIDDRSFVRPRCDSSSDASAPKSRARRRCELEGIAIALRLLMHEFERSKFCNSLFSFLALWGNKN